MTVPTLELLTNGRFISMDDRCPRPEAVLVEGQRIAFIGALDEAKDIAQGRGPSFRTRDMGGRLVTPGLIDTHAHMERVGVWDPIPTMAGLHSRREVLDRIAELVAKAKAGDWVITMPIGTPPFYFFGSAEEEEALYPTRWELDEVAPENPVYIRPIIGFWRWSPLPDRLICSANTRALELVGLGTNPVPRTPSVRFERSQSGEFTGRTFESTPWSIVDVLDFAQARPYTLEERVGHVAVAQAAAMSFGTTAVYEGHGVEPNLIDAYKLLHERGGLHIRAELTYSPSWLMYAGPIGVAVDRWLGWLNRGGVGDDQLRIRGIFLNPLYIEDDRVRAGFCCRPGIAGYNFDTGLKEDGILEVMRTAARNKLRLTGLASEFLPLVKRVGEEETISDAGWLIQHRSYFPPEHESIVRQHNLGISFLPVEAIYKQAGLAKREGTRLKDWMPLRRLIDSGLPVSIASDNIPVSLFFAIWCCLARMDHAGAILEDPDEPVTREEVLRLATLGGARCLGREETIGSVSPGKYADLIVLDRDYLNCPLDEVRDIRSLATMVNGQWRHIAPELADALA